MRVLEYSFLRVMEASINMLSLKWGFIVKNLEHPNTCLCSQGLELGLDAMKTPFSLPHTWLYSLHSV